jgi:hypothetical protein
MKLIQYFLNDAYTWYSMLDLIAHPLDMERWMFVGDVAAILHGYRNGTPIWTMPNPLIEVHIQKRADTRAQRNAVLDGLRSFGCVVDAQTLSFHHTMFGVSGMLTFVSKLGVVDQIEYPVMPLDELIEAKRVEARHWAIDPFYTAHVLHPQLEELIAIAASS